MRSILSAFSLPQPVKIKKKNFYQLLVFSAGKKKKHFTSFYSSSGKSK
jgi:hypothetical protein